MKILYATRDGQSRRIAERIARALAERGTPCDPQDLRDSLPHASELANSGLIALVAAVRYGRHLPEAVAFLERYRSLPRPPRLVLISVNLTARKPGKQSATGNAYLRKLIARHRLQPVHAQALAGRLDYPRYGWLDRQMIRLIMLMTGGPTDPGSCVEFTDWGAVDDLAGRIAEIGEGNEG